MSCHPECDPILRAGFLACHRCMRRSYPADGMWLDDDTVLVTWHPACRHVKPQTQIVRLSELVPCETAPEPRPCEATVRGGHRRGQPCSKPAAPGSTYCPWHAPARRGTS